MKKFKMIRKKKDIKNIFRRRNEKSIIIVEVYEKI